MTAALLADLARAKAAFQQHTILTILTHTEAPPMTDLISYRHKNAPCNSDRFVQRAVDPLPVWATDVQPHPEAPPMTSDTPTARTDGQTLPDRIWVYAVVPMDDRGSVVTGMSFHDPKQHGLIAEFVPADALDAAQIALSEMRRERDDANRMRRQWRADARKSEADAIAAQARIAELEAALEKLACRHVTENPLWWQDAARAALEDRP